MKGRWWWESGIAAALLLAGAGLVLAANAGAPGEVVHFNAFAPGIARDEPWRQAFTLRASFPGRHIPPSPYSYWNPDSNIAAGPSSLLVITNNSLVLLDKQGGVIASGRPWDFWASVLVPNEHGGSDPAALFDAQSQRFFYVAFSRVDVGPAFPDKTCTAGTCVANIQLAVSKSASPRTFTTEDWYLYSLDRTVEEGQPTASFGAEDKLHVGNNIVVVTWASFSYPYTTQEDYQRGVRMRILDKSKLIRGEPITTWIQFKFQDPVSGQPRFEPVLPAYGGGESGTLFFLRREDCKRTIFGLEDTLSSPQLRSLSVNLPGECKQPPNARQPGGAPNIYQEGVAIWLPTYRQESLWDAAQYRHNFGSGDVSAIRWAQIDLSGWPNTARVVQDGLLGEDGVWSIVPTIMADASNNLAILFARTSPSEFPSLYYTVRLATDPPNTLRPRALLKAGAASGTKGFSGYPPPHPSAGAVFYGDFFGMAVDPVDGSIWMVGEYFEIPDRSTTWVGNLVAIR